MYTNAMKANYRQWKIHESEPLENEATIFLESWKKDTLVHMASGLISLPTDRHTCTSVSVALKLINFLLYSDMANRRICIQRTNASSD